MKTGLRHRQLIGSFVAALILVCVWSIPAIAQCPLCKLAIENSTQGQAMGRGLNTGILVLLVPPVAVFCSIFVLAIKHRRAPEDSK